MADIDALLREAADLPNPQRTLLTHNERELIGFSNRLAEALTEATGGTSPTWRHTKGGLYREVCRAELQLGSNFRLIEGDKLVIYRSPSDRIWAREEHEFEDGRFQRVSGGGGRG